MMTLDLTLIVLKMIDQIIKRLSLNWQKPYCQKNLTSKAQSQTLMASFQDSPSFCLVLISNDQQKSLEKTLKSIEKQFYDKWHILLFCSKKTNNTIHFKNKNKITIIEQKNVTNPLKSCWQKALANTQSDYILSINCGNQLSQDALLQMTIYHQKTHADIFFSHESYFKFRKKVFAKPNYSKHLLLSQNFIGTFAAFNVSSLKKIALPNTNNKSAFLYTLFLHIADISDNIKLIPIILNHKTTKIFPHKDTHYEKKALSDFLSQKNSHAKILKTKHPGCYEVYYPIEKKPLISIIIPFKDKIALLKDCLDSILDKSNYPNFEIILISNNSSEKKTFDIIKHYQKNTSNIVFFEKNIPFNYSTINNFAATKAKGEFLLFLNNDTKVINTNWLEKMLCYAQKEDIGAVGAKLYYANKRIQHAGVKLGKNIATHSNSYQKDKANDSSLHCIRQVSAVTAACLMIEKKKFNLVGGFNETNLAVAFNDVDLCLKLIEKGYKNLFTPHATLYHFESLSRGTYNTKAKKNQYQKEKAYMLKTWPQTKLPDPYLN